MGAVGFKGGAQESRGEYGGSGVGIEGMEVDTVLLTLSPQCASLMLIESTRDSLCFSVAHYKHIKQQYALQVGDMGHMGWGVVGPPSHLMLLLPPPQAKSAEEKRVWTHHIKRLILENHHAIVPQKVRAHTLVSPHLCLGGGDILRCHLLPLIDPWLLPSPGQGGHPGDGPVL